VVYGHGRASQPLVMDARSLEQALTGVDVPSTLIELTVDGQKLRALIREIQRHPIRPDIIHVDFYEIRAEEKITLRVPVHLVGIPEGVRNGGGVLDQVMRDVEIEVLPEHIPDRVELDVTQLLIGHSLHAGDLVIPNAKLLAPQDLTICTVVPPRAEEVVAPTPEATAEVAEPELIRPEREEDLAEGEGEPEGKGGKDVKEAKGSKEAKSGKEKEGKET
jgi:large subunit ribosomal protein L25